MQRSACRRTSTVSRGSTNSSQSASRSRTGRYRRSRRSTSRKAVGSDIALLRRHGVKLGERAAIFDRHDAHETGKRGRPVGQQLRGTNAAGQRAMELDERANLIRFTAVERLELDTGEIGLEGQAVVGIPDIGD